MLRVFILLALVLQDPPKEKIELRVRPVEGDKVESFSTWTHTFRGRLGDEAVNFSTRGGQRFVSEMSRVQGGRLAGKIIEVADSYIETQDPRTGKYVRKDDPIHGRKVTIEMRDGREARTGVAGLSELDQRTLTMDDPLTRLFPDKPVAVGETWEIAGEGLKKFFPAGDFTEGRIIVSLRDVREVEGRRCAFLGTNYQVSTKTPDGVSRELHLLGTLTVWIDRGYVLAMSQSGRMTTTGADPKTAQPNGEAAITGELKAVLVEKPK